MLDKKKNLGYNIMNYFGKVEIKMSINKEEITDKLKKSAFCLGNGLKRLEGKIQNARCCSCSDIKSSISKENLKKGAEYLSNGAVCAKDNIKSAYESVKDDIKAIRDRDPAATSDLQVLLLYSGLHATMAHRVAHYLHKKGYVFVARAISQGAKFVTGIEIHPGATIGKGFVIDHGSGIVIGETAEIGDNCTLYQGVTLGGTGKDTGKRHPTLGDNVLVGAGAKVLGPFKVGSNSKIAANAVVLKEIPENSTAVGVPAKVVKVGNTRINELDQIHIPDPVAQEIARLEKRLAALEKIKASENTENQ